MKTNVFVVCKYKLGSADEMLPILLEIYKNRYRDVQFVFLFPNSATLKLNMLNYDLWAGIQSLRPKIVTTRGRGRIRTLWSMFKIFTMAVGRKNVFFKMTDVLPKHRKFMRQLSRISPCFQIRCYLRPWGFEMAHNLQIEEEIVRKRRRARAKKEELEGDCDFFVSTISTEDFRRRFDVHIDGKEIRIGYPKQLPAWKDFLENRAKVSKIVQGKQYCLYIVGPLEKRIEVLDEPTGRELLEETLAVLRLYEGQIRVVFKPHAATDVKSLEESIRRSGIENYVIDYGHAMVLASGAQFIISYYYSETMIDAFFLGRPIIEYNQLDPELLSAYGGWSVAGKCCDFFVIRNKRELESVIGNLLNGGVGFQRDSKHVDEYFQNTSMEFYSFLDMLFMLPRGQ